MAKVKRIALLGLGLSLLGASSAYAGFQELIGHPVPVIVLNILLLLLTAAGWFLCSRIRSFLRGGELIVGWFLILISFFFLFTWQVLELGRYFGFLEVSMVVVYVARLLWIAILVLGIYFVQKVMS